MTLFLLKKVKLYKIYLTASCGFIEKQVNGKALMLDEIINYVQSLQHQVEFLSMKLATVNPMYYDFGLDIDTLMVTTEQRLTALASPRPLLPQPPPRSMHPCNATQQILMPDSTNPLATSSIFCLLDNSSSLPIHQEFMPNISPRGSGQHLWDLDDQMMHKLVNQQLSEFNSY
ncbi:hypothetical protein Leryth_026339 [Lithospermum erythrorhizon]|nr:hypothetical protein Leryth_026339 [Lithospermum erythrorhizon]